MNRNILDNLICQEEKMGVNFSKSYFQHVVHIFINVKVSTKYLVCKLNMQFTS